MHGEQSDGNVGLRSAVQGTNPMEASIARLPAPECTAQIGAQGRAQRTTRRDEREGLGSGIGRSNAGTVAIADWQSSRSRQ